MYGWFNTYLDNGVDYATQPRELPNFTGMVAIASGSKRESAILPNGLILCGVNAGGEARCAARLDSGFLNPSPIWRPPTGTVAIAVGGDHRCWVVASGEALCAGSNHLGQLGSDGGGTSGFQARAVAGLPEGVSSITLGDAHTCALASGRVKCWGSPAGDGTSIGRRTPVDVAGLNSDIVRIASGPSGACAISRQQGLWCWGSNPGNGTAGGSLVPAGVIGLSSGVIAHTPGVISGLWWNPAEPGWGIHLTERGRTIFGVIYAYDASGRPAWHAAPSCVIPLRPDPASFSPLPPIEGAIACTSPLYEVSGGQFLATTFDPAATRATVVGALHLSISTRNAGTLTYEVNGIARTVPIVRQMFGNGATRPAIDYTDLWWQPRESGWGLAITRQFDVMFLAWYVYDESGRPTWYAAPDCRSTGEEGCAGVLYRTEGPVRAAAFDPSQVHVVPAGSVSMRFSDPNNGTLSYTVGGTTSSKAVTRQLF
jgi:hypothetical protein